MYPDRGCSCPGGNLNTHSDKLVPVKMSTEQHFLTDGSMRTTGGQCTWVEAGRGPVLVYSIRGSSSPGRTQ